MSSQSSKSIPSSKFIQSQPDVLSQISEFIARYLSCSHHQRTVLALWVLHTYCVDAAQVTPYLSIQSAHKQSGKTLCLHLLQLLCNFPALATGFPASQLNKLLNGPNCTFLIDECQATLGTRTRSKAPTLRAFLTCGFQRDPELLGSLYGPNAFRPKVFASMGQLPEPLADRSIPIILEPIQNRVAPSPSAVSSLHQPPIVDQKIARFNLRQATADAKSLREHLRNWAKVHLPALKEADPYPEEDFPPNLSPRRQDMIEPLMQLADAVGGQWPARICEAVVTLFEEGTAFDLQPNLQVLAELHRCFFHYGFPERLSTSALIEWMQSLTTRPWDTDGPVNAHKLARLLYPFEIRPRLQRIGSEDRSRGYQLADFLEPWRRHLGFIIPGKTLTAPKREGEESAGGAAAGLTQGAPRGNGRSPSASQVPEGRHSVPPSRAEISQRDFPESKIANKNVHCHTVTHAEAVHAPTIRIAEDTKQGANLLVPNMEEANRAL